ncbi:MAG: UDP-N-acetylmuramoyl-tripeptide--D-alanyl-D-alanine ligase [Elusimicrobia bacterium]|nr:UDP-N-acetylmuramoyl-tripeptide--D-alanyl-D-alanine ligase [Elusimicrobiota bacterium]
MLTYSWSQLAVLCGGRLAGAGAENPRRVVIDSRAVQPGDLFVALQGERRDGHEFLKDVAAAGAAGALVSREVGDLPATFGQIRVEETLAGFQRLARAHREKMNVRVVGITGSNGKTTTKEMLAHLFRESGRTVLATRGNLNSQVGLPLMLLELDSSHSHAVFEMGASGPGDLARLAELARPHIGVVTGIGKAHLETFGSLDGVLAAKWELVEGLGKDGIAFLNADDPRLLSRRATAQCPVVTFGRSAQADVRAENLRVDPNTAFDLTVGGARVPVHLPVTGLFNVTNALAAAAVALWERILLPEVARGLGGFAPPAQRMQMRRRIDGSLFLIDAYNANPDSMAASLASFAQAFPHWPRVAVLGSMLELGASAEPEHRELGRTLAGSRLDKILFVGPEGPWVREGYEAAGGKGFFKAGEDREEIRRELSKVITPDSVVLFKASRGVRLEDIYEPFLVPGEGGIQPGRVHGG